MKNLLWMLLAAAVLSFTACSKSNTRDGASSSNSSTAGQSSSSTTGASGGGGIQVSELERQQAEMLKQLVVYFDYDQAEIKPEFNAMLAAHGKYLAANAAATLRLEGNTDERGSREYNIGLGERRAQSVKRAMMLQGVAEAQISTVSYGEERPAAAGSDESAWAQNRRVEIVYLAN